MCKMRKLRVSLIAIVMFLFCSVGFASAQTMMLEYDGGTHEYNGEIYALVVNNQLINPPPVSYTHLTLPTNSRV